MTELTRLYPPWKEAVGIIAARVAQKGYGIILSHEELLDLFDLKMPAIVNAEIWRNHQIELLQNRENLKEALMVDHNIYLLNIRGLGYQVLPPGEQIEVVPRKYLKKIHNLIIKSIKSLIHVAEEMLDEDQQKKRLRNLEKLAFLKGAAGRKQMELEKREPLKLEKK